MYVSYAGDQAILKKKKEREKKKSLHYFIFKLTFHLTRSFNLTVAWVLALVRSLYSVL